MDPNRKGIIFNVIMLAVHYIICPVQYCLQNGSKKSYRPTILSLNKESFLDFCFKFPAKCFKKAAQSQKSNCYSRDDVVDVEELVEVEEEPREVGHEEHAHDAHQDHGQLEVLGLWAGREGKVKFLRKL